MNGGHQIINRNRSHVGPRRKDAAWTLDDDQVKALLQRVFPRLALDERERERAGRWARIIHLYYRLGYSYGDAAAELKIPMHTVRNVLARMRRARANRPCNGNKGVRKRDTTGTSLGDQ
jgi:hypothetical protein